MTATITSNILPRDIRTCPRQCQARPAYYISTSKIV